MASIKKGYRAAGITIGLALIVDQVTKILVKTHLYLDQSIPVFDHWFYIHFIENAGMAFGLQFGGSFGKLLLSIFRLILIVGIAWYLMKLIKTKSHKGLIISVSLIFAGAIGNIIDSAFYGLIFSNSPLYSGEVATLFPPGGGYAGFLHGRVVDMLYFPILHGHFPDWFPVWGGQAFEFFRPIFNVADSCISIGLFLILLNQKRFYQANKKIEKHQRGETDESPKDTPAPAVPQTTQER